MNLYGNDRPNLRSNQGVEQNRRRNQRGNHGRNWHSNDAGMALIVALLMVSVLSVLGLGLGLVVSTDPLAAANQREASATHYVARGGLELAIQELAVASSWDSWLNGAATSSLVDGASSGTRTLPLGEALDIDRLTNLWTCGDAEACTDDQIATASRDRPWGANNPRWRPILHGPAPAIGLGDATDLYYVIVWIGDDEGEVDGRPEVDGALGEGGGVVRLLAQAFGPFHSRQAVEAVVSRRCDLVDGTWTCVPGIRVEAWRAR